MRNTKIYARQVNPEYQDAYIFDDEYFNELIVAGNDRFCERNEDLLNEIDNAAEDIYNFVYELTEHDTIEELTEVDCVQISEWLSEHYTTEKHTSWTIEELKRFISAFDEREEARYNGYRLISKSPENLTAAMLSIYTGEKWECATIRGCSQSEWQTVYYSTEKYDKEDIEIFQVGYFNTGTQWIIHDKDNTPQCAEDINGYNIYCYSYDPRKEIAKECGVNPEDVILYGVTLEYMLVYSLV